MRSAAHHDWNVWNEIKWEKASERLINWIQIEVIHKNFKWEFTLTFSDDQQKGGSVAMGSVPFPFRFVRIAFPLHFEFSSSSSSSIWYYFSFTPYPPQTLSFSPRKMWWFRYHLLHIAKIHIFHFFFFFLFFIFPTMRTGFFMLKFMFTWTPNDDVESQSIFTLCYVSQFLSTFFLSRVFVLSNHFHLLHLLLLLLLLDFFHFIFASKLHSVHFHYLLIWANKI